ncbi:MAG: hypothetical protein JXA30_06990 [Deltaproteobacteria bacterium]|nr:hypothetical protein [Deltaproteobacteria bacterium]
MRTKEKQQALVEQLRTWQKLENAAITQTSKIMEETDHPLIRAVAEIIQRDSHMHYRIQQLIIDSFEEQAIPLLMDQLDKVWETADKHLQIEKKTIEAAEKSLATLEKTRNVVQLYLLNYLLADEKKHERLLTDLDLIKRKMYP